MGIRGVIVGRISWGLGYSGVDRERGIGEWSGMIVVVVFVRSYLCERLEYRVERARTVSKQTDRQTDRHTHTHTPLSTFSETLSSSSCLRIKLRPCLSRSPTSAS